MIKPAVKEHFLYASGAKAWRANSLAELRRLYTLASQLIPREEILIQDFIPGDGACQFACCAFFKNGRSLATVVICRRRQHPIEFGRASTYVESVDIPSLEQVSERFLDAVSYYGLVELEHKRDPRNGRYCLLDVNARTWGYHSIGYRAGIDFAYLLFCDQIDLCVTPAHGKVGVHWARLLTDLPTGLLGMLQGGLDYRDFFKSLRQIDEEAVFSQADPFPGIVEIALLPYLWFKRGF